MLFPMIAACLSEEYQKPKKRKGLFVYSNQCSYCYKFPVNYFAFARAAKYCYQLFSLYICMSHRLYVWPLAYLKSDTSKLHEIFSTCQLWPFSSSDDSDVMYFQFCGCLCLLATSTGDLSVVTPHGSKCSHPMYRHNALFTSTVYAADECIRHHVGWQFGR